MKILISFLCIFLVSFSGFASQISCEDICVELVEKEAHCHSDVDSDSDDDHHKDIDHHCNNICCHITLNLIVNSLEMKIPSYEQQDTFFRSSENITFYKSKLFRPPII